MTKAKTPKVVVTKKKEEVTVAKYPKIGRGIVTQVGENAYQIKGSNGNVLTFTDYYSASSVYRTIHGPIGKSKVVETEVEE